MIKDYSIIVQGSARDWNGSWNWGSEGALTTPEGIFSNRKIPIWYSDWYTLNPEKYNYYYPLSQEYLTIKNIVKMLKELGFTQDSDILFYNNYLIHDNRPSNLGITYGTCIAYMSLPFFSDDFKLAVYWDRSGNNSYSNASPSCAFYLIKNGVSIAGKSFSVTTSGSYDARTNFKIVKNEKTGEFLITNMSNTQNINDSGRIDIFFGYFKSGTENLILFPDNDKNSYVSTNSFFSYDGVRSYSAANGQYWDMYTPHVKPDKSAGYFNTSVKGNNVTDSIILPFYLGELSYVSNTIPKILLDKSISSLKKARGSFKMFQEYIIDNELYYCMYQYEDYAILFNEGVTVSK